MILIKKIARKTIIPLVYKTGIHNQKIIHSNKNFILCYHGVSYYPNFGINNRFISVNEFEKNLIYFKKNFQVVTLNEIFDDYRNGVKSSKPKVAFTFDDGYVNNLTTALPLLEKYNIPATFFILSAGLEDENFMTWSDIIDIAVYANKLESFIFHDKKFIKQNHAFFEEATNEDFFNYIKNMGHDREYALKEFKSNYLNDKIVRLNNDYWKLLNKKDLRICAEHPLIEIGSHTHKHYNLGKISIELAKDELLTSKHIIEKVIQKDVISIAFPDGDYNDEVKNECEKIGYKNLCAVNYLFSDDRNDKRILNRFSISNSTTHESNVLRLSIQINDVGI